MALLVYVLFCDNEFIGVYQLEQTALDVAVKYIDSKYPTSKYLGKRKVETRYTFSGQGVTTTFFYVNPGPSANNNFVMHATKLDSFVRV